jgi:hypothetical protein
MSSDLDLLAQEHGISLARPSPDNVEVPITEHDETDCSFRAGSRCRRRVCKMLDFAEGAIKRRWASGAADMERALLELRPAGQSSCYQAF